MGEPHEGRGGERLIEPDVMDVMDAALGDHGLTLRLLAALTEARYTIASVRREAMERAMFVLSGMLPGAPIGMIMYALAEEGVYVVARPELRQDLISQRDGSLLATHPADRCEGRNCVIHNPSDHALKDAPIDWDPGTRRTNRICTHGVHHPDPDHLSFVYETYGMFEWMQHKHHRCDGCCKTEPAGPTEGTTHADPR